jgi:hypothetical protein
MIISCRTTYHREIFVGLYALLRAITKVFPFITENSGCDFSQRVAQDAEIVGGGVFPRLARSRMPFAMLISIGTRAESSHLSSQSKVRIRARSCSGDSLGSLLLRSCLEGILFHRFRSLFWGTAYLFTVLAKFGRSCSWRSSIARSIRCSISE